MAIRFTSAPLNRFAFLRPNAEFIKQICEFPETRLVFFRKDPVRSNYRVLIKGKGVWYYPIKQDKEIGQLVAEWADQNLNEDKAVRDSVTAVFLGLDEHPGSGDSPLTSGDVAKIQYEEHSGVPFLAVDLSRSPEIADRFEKLGGEYLSQMGDILALSPSDASVYSYAKMYLDWLSKYNFCPGCGHPMIPLDAGTRLQCTNPAKDSCPIQKTKINNVNYPRQDPVVICALRNARRDKILLGHNCRRRQNQKKFYSCFSGFMEPGETIEGAVTREVWEETGLKLNNDNVQIVKSQPWPFPCCLMVGCVGVADSDVKINLELDKELDDCQWFDASYVADLVYGRPTDGKIDLPDAGSVAWELIKMVVDECHSKL